MEVVRDRNDNCIIVCSIENFDPMGIHTGDSITVAPAQTLTDKEYQIMRNASMAVLREIGVETGGSNVQFGINPKDGRMVIIEMNPRVSRSSALASKATGFPIAKIAAKLAVGYTLDELKNDITEGKTPASFEPSIDYVVTKVPRFNFEKFAQANDRLTTQMKSVGEVMAIGRNFQESLQKALRGLEIGKSGLDPIVKLDDEDARTTIEHELEDAGLYALVLSKGLVVHEEVHNVSLLGAFLHPANILVCRYLVLVKAEGYIVGQGVVAEQELELGLRFPAVNVIGALPAHDVAGAFREHGLVSQVIDHFADAVGIDELRIAEGNGLDAKQFLNLGSVLANLVTEFTLRSQGGQGVIVRLGQELHLAGGGQGTEAVNHLRGKALELVQGAAGDGIGNLEFTLVLLDEVQHELVHG